MSAASKTIAQKLQDKEGVFITQWALSRGIFFAEVAKDYGQYVEVNYSLDGQPTTEFYNKGDDHYHYTVTGAVARADAMRKNKVASLHRQLAKFTVIDYRAQCAHALDPDNTPTPASQERKPPGKRKKVKK